MNSRQPRNLSDEALDRVERSPAGVVLFLGARADVPRVEQAGVHVAGQDGVEEPVLPCFMASW
jgi:hypothetical protein